MQSFMMANFDALSMSDRGDYNGPIIDGYGRKVTNLRISVTQRCDLKCGYCHREGERAPEREMSPEEFVRISKLARRLGITKLKLTGGEPLMRKDLEAIVESCKPYFREISLTTNGRALSKRACGLSRAGLSRVNVSLDTLEPVRYKKLTGVPGVNKVIEGIDEANRQGLVPVKVNMVVMKDFNEDEIFEMAHFCESRSSILQLIELETTKEEEDCVYYKSNHADLRAIEEDLARLSIKVVTRELHNRKKYIIPVDRLPKSRKKWKTSGEGIAEIEVVRPMHNTAFCANCTRIRITSDGKMKPCLLRSDNHLELVSMARSGKSEEELLDAMRKAIAQREPYWR